VPRTLLKSNLRVDLTRVVSPSTTAGTSPKGFTYMTKANCVVINISATHQVEYPSRKVPYLQVVLPLESACLEIEDLHFMWYTEYLDGPEENP
jgi:hypothetical protein